jgi:hypothetical protein
MRFLVSFTVKILEVNIPDFVKVIHTISMEDFRVLPPNS